MGPMSRHISQPQRPTTGVLIPRLISVREAAQLVGVATATITRAYRCGEIRVFRTPRGGVVRVYADSLAQWVLANSYGSAK